MSEPKDDRTQYAKPDGAHLQYSPVWKDYYTRLMQEKYPVIEDQFYRPVRNEDPCHVEKFAYHLCRRNMTVNYARKACFKEFEDIGECYRGAKREQRADVLKKASQKVGDRIPALYGSANWIH